MKRNLIAKDKVLKKSGYPPAIIIKLEREEAYTKNNKTKKGKTEEKTRT